MDRQAILTEFSETLMGLGREDPTIRKYTQVAGAFLNEVEADLPTQRDALRYLGRMRDGYKANSRNLYYYALKALFGQMGWAWDIPAPKSKTQDYEQLDQPVLATGEIQQIIESAKRHQDPELAAYFAVSSTYGLRRCQLAAIRPEHLQDGKLFVQPSKGGRPYRHQIPPQIAPHLEGIRWRGDIKRMDRLFKYLLFSAFGDIADYYGYGWHAVRRALVTELNRRGLDIMLLYKFMRWKAWGMITMPLIYSHLEDEATDQAIFEKHPFLGMWGAQP